MKGIKVKEGQKIGGYAGKILRINLTDSTTEIISTWKYAPKYIGGWAMCNAIFWDDIKENIDPFDPRNETVFCLGPGAGTGIPIMGRAEICGIAANNLPTQYTHSNMSGLFNGVLKWAGYDGFIVTGKAPKHTYVFIDDDKVSFLDADEAGLWGELVHESQKRIFELHGDDVQSIVIGPAGENLCRIASLTNGNDSVSAKAGFGAVWGSKNLKAVAVRGTGSAKAAMPADELIKLRSNVGNPMMVPNPLVENRNLFSMLNNDFRCDDEWACKSARLAGCWGCNSRCNLNTAFEIHDPLNPGRRVTEVCKCVERWAANFNYDCGYNNSWYVHSKRQQVPNKYVFSGLNIVDPDDPMLPILKSGYHGDSYNFWDASMEMGQTVNWLCTQYGIDKWDVIVWLMTWLMMCQKEGLFDELDFGMDVDMNNPKFMMHILRIMTYREGPYVKTEAGDERRIGDILAEGMARAVRILGKKKYGDSIYHDRHNLMGKRLDIPVSWESTWGQSTHWQGRGYQACPKPWWLNYNANMMLDSRDSQGNGHMHMWAEDMFHLSEDPSHNEDLAKFGMQNDLRRMMKDSLVSCEWHVPDDSLPDQEAWLYHAATGIDVTEQDIYDACETGRLLYRAILIRNHERTRDLEVENAYPIMTYPDPFNEVVTWDEWNDYVDLVYKVNGFDRATGWPFRSVLEEYGLKEVADELEAIGKLPPEGGTPGYVRKANPFDR